jgi:hypothetical protein
MAVKNESIKARTADYRLIDEIEPEKFDYQPDNFAFFY